MSGALNLHSCHITAPDQRFKTSWGQIDLMFDQSSNSLPHARDGKIRALAVTGKTRLASAPDIPTVDEAGLALLHLGLAWNLDTDRDARTDRREAQRRCRGGTGRSRTAPTTE